MWCWREGKKERWYLDFPVQLHNLQLLPSLNFFWGGRGIEKIVFHYIMLVCNTPVFNNSISPLHLTIKEFLSQCKDLTFPPFPLSNTKDRDDNNAFNFLASMYLMYHPFSFFTFFYTVDGEILYFCCTYWGGFHFCFVFTNLHLIYLRSLLFRISQGFLSIFPLFPL